MDDFLKIWLIKFEDFVGFLLDLMVDTAKSQYLRGEIGKMQVDNTVELL